VVLPASGCEMIANVRRRAISSLRLVINPLQLLLGSGTRSATAPLATDMMASSLFANCCRLSQLQPHRESKIAVAASTANLQLMSRQVVGSRPAPGHLKVR
jgi:hypothetical protein